MADGSVLVGGGDLYAQTWEPRAMVGKLHPDGYLEAGFGEGGMVMGDGFVESLRVLSDGGISGYGGLGLGGSLLFQARRKQGAQPGF